jgi:tetratricopeptide (TPR) repeat protein
MDKQFYEGILTTARSQGNRSAEASALGSLGNLYAGEGNYSRAIDYHNQAMQIYESMSDRNGIALTAYNLAGIYEVGLGNLRTAIQCFEKAVLYSSGPAKDKYSRMLEQRRQQL